MPYKYIVDVDSKSFGEAPSTIMKILQRLTWAGRQAVMDGSFKPFNELLAVGYFEEQRMNVGLPSGPAFSVFALTSRALTKQFHDDGEKGLGPTVATYSLGADANMSFRMKRVYHTGFSRAGVFRGDEAPLLGCANYAERFELYNDGEELLTTDPERWDKLMDKCRRSKNSNAPPAVSLTLRHGDFLVMHGADIQKYYEVRSPCLLFPSCPVTVINNEADG